ncbi:hypothetical protein [Flavobacterium sp.]|uniref:HYC_CC_PP family protein n=1 Tax=Flavobacterium sp. TaxID=239 RepID=UPI002489460E|nr:hypothetical protein [Flavobacterium sp.]MDI1315825.1 hypothetical protein [Flavobacterium sp.]
MIFKKHISLLVALLVLVSNSGLAFTVHYCEGKIASISSIFSEEEICGPSASELTKQIPDNLELKCCAKPEITHKECCSDKKINLKIKTEKIIIKTLALDCQPAYFSSYNYSVSSIIDVENSSDKFISFYGETNAPPLYKLYCQLTFYA